MLTSVVRAEVAPVISIWRTGVAVLATPLVSSTLAVLTTSFIPVHMVSVESGKEMYLIMTVVHTCKHVLSTAQNK